MDYSMDCYEPPLANEQCGTREPEQATHSCSQMPSCVAEMASILRLCSTRPKIQTTMQGVIKSVTFCPWHQAFMFLTHFYI